MKIASNKISNMELVKHIEPFDPVVCGILYEFAGFLTTRPERIVASASDDATPMSEAVKEFLILKNVDYNCDPIFNWEMLCSAALNQINQPEE